MKQGVLPTSQESVTSSAPKVGLWVFLAVVSSLFGLFASAYSMRMAGHGGLASWQPLDEPNLLWINTLILVLASGAMQVARNRIDNDDLTGGRSYFLAAGCADASCSSPGQVLAWQQARASQRPGAGQPGVQLLRPADRAARPAPHRRPLGARPHDARASSAASIRQRRRAQPCSLERAALHDVLALAAAGLARCIRVAVVDLNEGTSSVMAHSETVAAAGSNEPGWQTHRHRLVRGQADVPGPVGQSDDVDLPAERHVHLLVLPHGLHERARVHARAVAEPERGLRARRCSASTCRCCLIGIMTFVLITSSGTMALAVNYGYRRDRGRAAALMFITAAFGAIFVGMQAFEWTQAHHRGRHSPVGQPDGCLAVRRHLLHDHGLPRPARVGRRRVPHDRRDEGAARRLREDGATRSSRSRACTGTSSTWSGSSSSRSSISGRELSMADATQPGNSIR